jgi:DNA (cytosine-5)-methyltransferase 1
MRYLSLFSGIEAASVAWKPLGWECVGVAEIEKFPCKVLAHHYLDVPNLGDITKITEADIAALGQIDLVVFGAPCQDLSVAGKRKGMLDEHGNITRSGLFFTAINIVTWARKYCGCRFAIYENVPGLYSSNKGADFASVVEHMAGLDDVTAPQNGWGTEGCAVGDEGMLEWACLDAQFVRTPLYPFAVPQRRRRVFAIADFGDWTSRPPILLEPESLRGDTPTRRSKGQETSRNVIESSGISSTVGALCARDFKGVGSQYVDEGKCVASYGIAGNIIGRQPENGGNGEGYSEDIGYTLTKTDIHAVAFSAGNSSQARSIGYSDEHTPPLRAGCSGTNQVPTIAFTARDYGNDAVVDITPTMRSLSCGSDGHQSGSHGLAVAFQQNTRDEVRLMNGDGQICGALAAEAGMKQQNYIAFNANARPDEMKFETINGGLTCSQNEAVAEFNPVSATLKGSKVGSGTPDYSDGNGHSLVGNTMQVRRLTPLECERLQGFPDDYTDILGASDSTRYKALGNSMACNVMHYIGQRIQAAIDYKP